MRLGQCPTPDRCRLSPASRGPGEAAWHRGPPHRTRPGRATTTAPRSPLSGPPRRSTTSVARRRWQDHHRVQDRSLPPQGRPRWPRPPRPRRGPPRRPPPRWCRYNVPAGFPARWTAPRQLPGRQSPPQGGCPGAPGPGPSPASPAALRPAPRPPGPAPGRRSLGREERRGQGP